jgi:hypothetical protein
VEEGFVKVLLFLLKETRDEVEEAGRHSLRLDE